MVVLPLPPPRQPSPGVSAPTDPRGRGGGGTEAQEAEQEASPAAAFSWGSGKRGGAASGAREPPPPPGWGECAAPRVGRLPGAGSPPLCLGLARQQESGMARGTEQLSPVAARIPPPLSCLSPAPTVCRGQMWGQRNRRRVGIRVQREDRAVLGEGCTARAGACCGGSAVGMNDRARQGALGAPWRQHPVPPAWPAALGLRSGARPASALNLEELRRKARAGDSGRLGRPRVRYCSFSGSGSPSACPRLQARHSGPELATRCPLPVLVLFPPQL